MPKIRMNVSPTGAGKVYVSPSVRMVPGQVLDVPGETAKVLLSDFPGCFVLVEDAPAAALAAPQRVVTGAPSRGLSLDARLRGAGVSERQIGLLEKSGWLVERELRAGLEDDAQLLSIAGIGAATVEKIRKALEG